MSNLRLGTLIADISSNKTAPSSSYVALDLLFHTSSFSKVLAAADVLDIIGTPVEKAAFAELKALMIVMLSSNQNDSINIQPFLDKLSDWTLADYYSIDQNDVLSVWDDIVKLILVVIPPLREVFLGQVSSALEVPGWVNLMSRCFHADFNESTSSLEEVYLNSLTSSPSAPISVLKAAIAAAENDSEQLGTILNSNTGATAVDKLRIANAMVLRRAPEILVVSIESSYLPYQCMTQPGPVTGKGPSAIRFPETFDLTLFSSNTSNNSNSNHNNKTYSQEVAKIYDLSIVVALEGPKLESLQPYSKIQGEDQEERWYRGAGFTFEEVPKEKVVEGNFFNANTEKKVHPRFLVYTRRDLRLVLDRTLHLVSKAGQMRALGDVAFALAMTTCENYGEARRCYEEAITLDESLRVALQENLSSLEKIERTQRARVLEEQADLALANKRFREASELYSKGMMNAVVSSGVYLRVRDKLESVTHIIALDSACQFAEKGEEALKLGLLPSAKDLYSQAFKLNPEFLHLHTILVGIDKTVQMQTAGQRIADAQTAAKAYHYKLANHFYREAIALVPEKLAGLQSTLDSLAPLMQGEDALMRQKSGLAALEDKRYAAAIQLFTEAIGLLPQTQASCLEHAVFLCDRALAHYDLKDFNTAVLDCTAALALKSELAIAHFRLGAAQFGLDQFDLASISYDRALKCDPSLSESIKVKVRQVTTAREIQQRKEREAERAKIKKEEKKLLDEKRARDELLKKERGEKLALEQAEKAERNRIKEEERKMKAAKEKEQEKEKEKEREAEKEKLRAEKAERDAQKVAERERAKLEKEKERERVRIEKEQKAIDTRRIQDEEKQRQLEFTAELERGAARQRDAEREKEVEKERARLEREKLISERERSRREKLEAETARVSLDATKLATAPVLATPTASEEESQMSSTKSRTTNKIEVSTASALKSTVPVSASSSSSSSLRWSAVAVQASPISSSSAGLVQSDDDMKCSDISLNSKKSSSNNTSKAGSSSKVWTASKYSADTITRVPTPLGGLTSSIKQKGIPLSTDSLADFPKLGDLPQRTVSEGNISEALSLEMPQTIVKDDDDEELGWSVRRTSPQRETAESPSSSFSAYNLSSSTDIFSSMAERPAMSTDYTFKPSERAIKAAEAKRLADSLQKAAAAAAAASSLSGTAKGDFDEFLSNSSASYISNFSSSIRFNPTLSADIAPSNGLFFSPSQSMGNEIRPSSASSNDQQGPISTFSSTFSGLGFSSSFLSSSGANSSTSSSSVGVVGIGSLGMGGIGINNANGHSQLHSITDECDDDYANGYFNNPLASLGGLDLDDSDPLLMAIGGLSLSPSDSPTTATCEHMTPSASSSSIHQLGLQSNYSSPQMHSQGPSSQGYSLPPFPLSINGGIQYPSHGQNFGYPSNSHSPPSSSSFSPRLSASPASFQRSFSGDLGQGQGQGGNILAFPSIGAFGGLRMSNSNGNIADAFSIGANDDYFGGNVQHKAGIATLPAYGIPQQQQQQQQLFSPFHTQVPASILGTVDRPPHAQSQIRPSFSSGTLSQSLSGLPPPPPPPLSTGLLVAPVQEGIEADMLPESAFTSVAWLRHHGMHMYRWAGDTAEWTEYAMHLPPSVVPYFTSDLSSPTCSILPELLTSGCKIWVDKETLLNREATFLVFLRGAAGQPSNASMNIALDLLSNRMRQLLPVISIQSQPFGSIGSHRLNTPPPPSISVPFPQRQPLSAWRVGHPFIGAPVANDVAVGVGLAFDEEEHSIVSDEYYDPEDLARSLSLHEDGSDDHDADWCTVPAKRSISLPSTHRPEPLRLGLAEGQAGGYVQRWLEIPRDSVGLVIGQGGKKIKDLCILSGAKIQFRVNKTAEREGRPGLLELQGTADNVDQGLQLVWDLLHLLGKEYQEVPVQRLK